VNLARFLATWNGLTLENRVNRLVILLLIGANMALAITLNRTERTVVLVPPVLEGAVTVARSSASQEVKEAWALFVAELLGNVSPTNAEFLTKALDPLLAPALRQDILQVLDAQIGEIRREKVSLSFQPRAVSHDPATGTLFVTGTHITSGPAAKPVNAERTYALRIEFKNYRPVVVFLDVYPGAPRTGPNPGEAP
jgi:conjugal transfer pilus assembly protein TraE